MFGDGEISTDHLSLRWSGGIAWVRRSRQQLLTAATIDGGGLAIDGLFRLGAPRRPGYLFADLDRRRISVYSDQPRPLDVQVQDQLLEVEINDSATVEAAPPGIAELMAG